MSIKDLRYFVNVAHNYAYNKHKCTLTILQEYEEYNYVVVALYKSDSNPEKDDPDTIVTLHINNVKTLSARNFILNKDSNSHIISKPTDLFRLIYNNKLYN